MMAGGFDLNNKNIAIGVVALIVIVAVAGAAYWMMNDGDQADATYTVSLSYDSETGTATGEGVYDAGEKVTVTATPANGYGFKGWFVGTEMVSEEKRYTFTAESNVVLTPSFRALYTISVDYDPEFGTVTGAGTYMDGDRCTLTLSLKEGCSLLHWECDGNVYPTSQNESVSFTVHSDGHYHVDMGRDGIPLTIRINNSEMGYATPNSGSLKYGESVELWAYPNEGYQFDHWEINGKRTNYSCTVVYNVTEAVDALAVFEVEQLKVSLDFDASMGIIAGVGNGTYNYGENIHIQAIPKAGYLFDHWEIDGKSYLNSEMTLTIYDDTKIKAIFVKS